MAAKSILPPENESLVIRLYDRWQGAGRETQQVRGMFRNGNYIADSGKAIPARLVTGWDIISQSAA